MNPAALFRELPSKSEPLRLQAMDLYLEEAYELGGGAQGKEETKLMVKHLS